LELKKILKRREITIPLIFIAAGIIAALIWWIYSYGTVRTDNAKIDADMIYVSSDFGGILVDFPIAEFSEVSMGETVAEIDPLIGTAERLKSENNLSAFSTLQGIKKEIEASEENLRLAEKNHERKKNLYASGSISKSEFEADEVSLSVLRSQLESAKNLYDMAENILNITEADTPYIPIKSPIDGYVADKMANVGELLSAGQPIFAVVDLRYIWVTAKIKEGDIADIKVGNKVKIKVDTYPGEVFLGKVEDIGVAASSVFSIIPQDNASGNYIKVTQTVPVRISIDPNGFVLRPGTNVVVRIFVNR
jgi:membrane fusion protein (multidrug efflux system)